jgi:hypothetical protein
MVGCDATFRSEADRWFTSAVEAEDTRDRTAARLHAQQAVHSDPQHTGALALLGLCQIRDGDRHSGRANQHLAAQLAPDDPNVLHFVGVGSWEREDGHQAIETLSRAVELESPHPSSVPVLAQILELSNRTAEAQTLLDRFAVSDPASQLLRARLLRRSGACGEALEVLDRIDPSAEGADPRLIHAERARCFDLSDHAEEAWEQVTFANEIAAQRSHHSPISPWFDRLSTVQRRRGPRRGSAATDAEPLEAGSWAGPTAFVVGFPRSGTTLIESLLTSAPGVTSTREVEAIGQAVAQVCAATGRGYLQLLSATQPSDPEAIRTAYQRVIDAQLVDRSSLVIDKLPLNVMYLGAIELAFPDTAVIVARRHPADAVLSAYVEQFADNPGTAQLNSLDGAAQLYNSVIGLWEAVRDVTTLRWIEVDYEQLVTSPESETTKISNFLGLGLDPTALLSTRATSARINTPSYTHASEPAHLRSVGRWRRYRQQLAPVLGTLGITP